MSADEVATERFVFVAGLHEAGENQEEIGRDCSDQACWAHSAPPQANPLCRPLTATGVQSIGQTSDEPAAEAHQQWVPNQEPRALDADTRVSVCGVAKAAPLLVAVRQ